MSMDLDLERNTNSSAVNVSMDPKSPNKPDFEILNNFRRPTVKMDNLTKSSQTGKFLFQVLPTVPVQDF